MEIYIDGDACPVKDEAIRVSQRHNLVIHLVGNTWLRAGNSSLINRVVVGKQLDAADDWIAERCGAGDIVITGDDRSQFWSCRFDVGEITGGGPSFTRQDRSRFLQALENAIQVLIRKS